MRAEGMLRERRIAVGLIVFSVALNVSAFVPSFDGAAAMLRIGALGALVAALAFVLRGNAEKRSKRPRR